LTKKIIAAALIALIALVSPASVGEAKAEPRGRHRRGRGRGWGPRYERPDPGSAFLGGLIGGFLGGILSPEEEEEDDFERDR
jgi:uncharacterized membrane protein YfcA